MRKALLLFSVAIFISVTGALAQQPNPGGGDVFNRETEGQDPGADGPTFSIPGLGPWLFGGQSSKYCGERPRYRGTARPGNIAKGYVTSYTECRSITICLTVDLDAGGVRHRAGDTVTLDLSYASKPTMPSNRPALGQPVNVPFLVEGTKLSATDVLIARTPFPSEEARQVRSGSVTAPAACHSGEPSPPVWHFPWEQPAGAEPLQGGAQEIRLQGSATEDRVTWQNWCEEYKRLLKEIVIDPLDDEFGGRSMLLRANVQFGFYNPQFNNAQSLRQQIRTQRSSAGATVLESPGIIVLISKAGFQYWTGQRQADDQVRFGTFQTRVKNLASELAKQIPAFPQHSRISYFSRPLKINLNDPKLAPNETGIRYGGCENFLDELESSGLTRKN
jgi:hypothetical protein